MLVGAFLLQAQIDVKGIVLGQPYSENVLTTTLGGIDVGILPFKINDGRVYSIVVAPSVNGTTVQRVYSSDVEKLKNGFEKKYGVKFRHINKEYDDSDYYLTGKVGDIQFYFSIEDNQFMSPPIQLTIIITDLNLEKINKREEQAKADSDF